MLLKDIVGTAVDGGRVQNHGGAVFGELNLFHIQSTGLCDSATSYVPHSPGGSQ